MSDDETQVLVPKDILTLNTDDRGRAYVGSDYKNAEVRVAVLDVERDEE